jgi:hypothetical protein
LILSFSDKTFFFVVNILNFIPLKILGVFIQVFARLIHWTNRRSWKPDEQKLMVT